MMLLFDLIFGILIFLDSDVDLHLLMQKLHPLPLLSSFELLPGLNISFTARILILFPDLSLYLIFVVYMSNITMDLYSFIASNMILCNQIDSALESHRQCKTVCMLDLTFIL